MNRTRQQISGVGRTNLGIKGQEVERTHLVAHRLVLEPWLVQDHLQLSTVKVRHPDGLGQPCILTLLHGLGKETLVKNDVCTWNPVTELHIYVARPKSDKKRKCS